MIFLRVQLVLQSRSSGNAKCPLSEDFFNQVYQFMLQTMFKYNFVLILIFQVLVWAHGQESLKDGGTYFDEFGRLLAGSNTPVWFLESNPKDPESPRLQLIPNALSDAGLISTNVTNNQISTPDEKNALYAEILVVVDYGLYKKVGENVVKVLEYVISFWNGVDLRYKLLNSPKIYINIAGIILAKDPQAAFYVHQSKDSYGHVNANEVLFTGGKYFMYEKKLKNHDIVVTMTTENICSTSSTGVCYSTIVGLSLLGKACHSYQNTAIIEDNGGFGGTIVAAHEVAHLMNVPHDGTGASASCPIYDGFIMTPSASTNENNMKWSKCSKDVLHKFSSSSDADCLRNKPRPGSPVRRILPGKLLSVNVQCARAGRGIPYFNGKRVCHSLLCFDNDSKTCNTDGPSAEGSFCGENLYCRDGECVPEF